MPTKLSLYDQVIADGAGLSQAAGDVPYIDANGVITRLPGVGAMRTIWSKSTDGSQQSGTSPIDLLADGTGYGSTVIPTANLVAGAAFRFRVVMRARNVAFVDTTFNDIVYALKLGSTSIFSYTHRNTVATGTDFYQFIDGDIHIHSYSDPNVSVHGSVVCVGTQEIISPGAYGWCASGTANVNNTADRQLYLYVTGPGSSSYFRWYSEQVVVWAIP